MVWGRGALAGFLAIFFLSGTVGSVHAQGGSSAWRISKTEWTATDERGYAEFIEAFGAADCWTLDECLKSTANPYRHTDPKTRFLADCADLPYFLRAYYAWKNGLPFAFQSAMLSGDGPGSDPRYSTAGNQVVGRDWVSATAKGANAPILLNTLRSTVSTAMFRHHAAADEAVNFTDMYAVKLSRDAIRPGTIVYDVNGHVAMVWRVQPDGKILTISSHPDNSLSRSFYGRQFLRTDPDLGAGFKNWRPIKLVGATKAPDGMLIGGQIEAVGNSEIEDFSLEQYLGTKPGQGDWQKAEFIHKGEPIDYYDYVRIVMAEGEFAYRPVEETRAAMRSLCGDIEARVSAVHRATRRGAPNQPHPKTLPDNIYGTYGSWENFSTPSRDARLKVRVKQLRDQVETFIGMHKTGNPRLAYQGDDLAGDMLAVYAQEAASCKITYRNSDKKPVTLTLGDVLGRLFDLSFDPYHCTERRWGAREPEELASCPTDEIKDRWYAAEQPLRYQIHRTYDVFMGHTLEALEAGPFGTHTGKGVETRPDLDIRAYLESQAALLTATIGP